MEKIRRKSGENFDKVGKGTLSKFYPDFILIFTKSVIKNHFKPGTVLIKPVLSRDSRTRKNRT
jgi:hypothetical protein